MQKSKLNRSNDREKWKEDVISECSMKWRGSGSWEAGRVRVGDVSAVSYRRSSEEKLSRYQTQQS